VPLPPDKLDELAERAAARQFSNPNALDVGRQRYLIVTIEEVVNNILEARKPEGTVLAGGGRGGGTIHQSPAELAELVAHADPALAAEIQKPPAPPRPLSEAEERTRAAWEHALDMGQFARPPAPSSPPSEQPAEASAPATCNEAGHCIGKGTPGVCTAYHCYAPVSSPESAPPPRTEEHPDRVAGLATPLPVKVDLLAEARREALAEAAALVERHSGREGDYESRLAASIRALA